MKVYVAVIYSGSRARGGVPSVRGAWLDRDEARKVFDAVPAPATLETCELHGAEDLAVLAAKLDEAHAEIARLRREPANQHPSDCPCPSPQPVRFVQYYEAGGLQRYCEFGGHGFPVYGEHVEPYADENCLYCGVRYSEAGLACATPCPSEKGRRT